MQDLRNNPFITRILQLFDTNYDGYLSGEEFRTAIEHFSHLSSFESKANCK